jgi:hypothetical protein
MPRVRDVLHRFRPSGAPGAATAAGVPVDRATELAAELQPVLALLEETERECADILERARVEESAIRARSADRARGVLVSGHALAEAERVAAVARTRAGGGGRTGASTVNRGAGGAAIAEHVELVVDAVRSLLGPPSGSR